jgi:hypothetical protein
MNVPVRSRAEVLRGLDGCPPAPDSVLFRCVAAIRADGREGWVWSTMPAAELAESTEASLRAGRSNGQTFIGEGELMERLNGLGDRRISLVYTDRGQQHFRVYCDAETGAPVAAMIIGPDPTES